MDYEEKNQESGEKREAKSDRISPHYGPGILILVVASVLIAGGIYLFGMASITRHANRSFALPMMAQIEGKSMRGIARGGITRDDFARVSTTGVLTAIDGNNLTVRNSSGTEFKIIVSDATSYIKANAIAKQSDLQVNNVISITGSSNSQGQIVATSIRIW